MVNYAEATLGKNARRASTGPIGHLKGKPTDKNKITGNNALTGLSAGAKPSRPRPKKK
jgi:hypothetical protein